MSYLFDTNIVIYYFNGLTADDTLHLRTKTPDAIIAATALVNDWSVVTHNTSDFSHLGLKTLTVTMKT